MATATASKDRLSPPARLIDNGDAWELDCPDCQAPLMCERGSLSTLGQQWAQHIKAHPQGN